MQKSKYNSHLNNKGFAITSIIYAMLLLFIVLMLLTIATLARKKTLLEKEKSDTLNALGIYDEVYTFGYTGAVQEFVVPKTGLYKIELWGASGEGNFANNNVIENSEGKGGYVSGYIHLNQNEQYFIYVGSYLAYNASPVDSETSGGGATDIRLVGGDWNNFDSLKSRIIVAAGGGGGLYNGSIRNFESGNAGGLSGYNAVDSTYPTYSGLGATQILGGATGTATSSLDPFNENMNGKFGIGGYSGRSSGGGGGYYGGGHGIHPGASWTGGGGGSSFISGHEGCNAINYSSSTGFDNIVHTGSSIFTKDGKNYIFSNTVMIDGAGFKWTNVKGEYTGMPTYNGQGVMTGNSGNGFAKISLVSVG